MSVNHLAGFSMHISHHVVFIVGRVRRVTHLSCPHDTVKSHLYVLNGD